MKVEVMFLLSYVIALLGQLADMYTTRRGLDSGKFVEKNGLIRRLVTQHWNVAMVLKVAVLPVLMAPLDLTLGHGAAIAWGLGYGASGWYTAVRNYQQLRRAGVRLW